MKQSLKVSNNQAMYFISYVRVRKATVFDSPFCVDSEMAKEEKPRIEIVQELQEAILQ